LNAPKVPAAPAAPAVDPSADAMSEVASPTRAPLRDERGLRLPREPYPGLRPFLDFEAALLFGRARQVREIIERLARTQFVAVLGGSGSGKSSLIHAGVTPELRSFGIPGAGDLWLTMVCTPGTNVAAADQAGRRHSPVARLVRRFAMLLKSRGSDEADQARLAEMAEVFRQDAGFARLLEAYAGELDVPPGPDPAEARVLVVIDQFEEVFHPTNKGVDDARVLVERVLDHFFRPHPRCHVVITMRSEHLNDCAAYLELPDAINKSSFLVRRLDGDELREAIVGPAQRFLRLTARRFAGAPEAARLPEQVLFEPAVLERLLRDVMALTHDPDHLPLLQHMLARLWQAALERDDAMDALVPARITLADLVRAVSADVGAGVDANGVTATLADNVNTLRASVHNWPERIWQSHGQPQQRQLDALFRRLALKDPNTGHYSQQRVEAVVAARQLGFGEGPAALVPLRRLLGEGFLGSVDYLFWDAEDPARITIKVSHESFIRGWRRFKALVDEEAAHYEAYLALVRRCAAWVEHQRGAPDLLSAGELRRLRASRVQQRSDAGEPLDDWVRLLALDRDGARLVRHAQALPAYVEESRRVDRRRNTWQRVLPLLVVLGMVFGMALASLFTTLVQSPSMRRAELSLDATSQAAWVDLATHYPTREDALEELRRLLAAAAGIDGARTGEGTPFGRTSVELTSWLGWLGVVRRQGEFVEGVLAHSEPEVNLKLRGVLNSSPLFEVPLPTTAAPVPAALRGECRPPPGKEGERDTAVQRGRILVAQSSRAMARAGGYVAEGAAPAPAAASPAGAVPAAGAVSAAGAVPPAGAGLPAGAMSPAGGDAARELAAAAPRRALFIPDGQLADQDLLVHSASWDAATARCVYTGDLALVLKAATLSHAVIDSGLRFVVFTAQLDSDAGSVSLQELSWRIGADGVPSTSQRTTLVSLADEPLLRQVREVAGEDRLRVVPTWSAPAGRVLDLAGRGWRIVPPLARRVETKVEAPDFRRAVTAAPGTPCRLLAATLDVKGWRMRMLDAQGLCLAVYRKRSERWATEQERESEVDELHLWVYPRPTPAMLARLDKRRLLPIASMEPYARVSASLPEEPQWMLGVQGPFKGWLTLRTREAPAGLRGEVGDGAAAAGGESHIGTPLTTCALWRLGQPLVEGLGSATSRADSDTCRESL
jgi:hypothetical protein